MTTSTFLRFSLEFNVSRLQHKAGNNAMKLAMLIGKAMLASTQCSEILAGAWLNVWTKVNDDAANWFAIYCNVQITSQSLRNQSWTGDFGRHGGTLHNNLYNAAAYKRKHVSSAH